MACLEIFVKEFEHKKLLYNEPMKNHTSFKIGGSVDLMILPENSREILEVVNLCNQNKISFFVFGNGSNLLISDNGIRGVVIKLGENFNKVQQLSECEIKAEAGISLAALANFALLRSLSGMEFASGIPGALGGAVYMNAGAYDGEMKDIVKNVELLSYDGKILNLGNEEMEFEYRKSIVQREKLIILNATIKLDLGDEDLIKEKMFDLNKRRKDKQPLEMASAGSTFKRPDGYFAGKLISESGLAGYSVGGAQVSAKHCGFIVNKGDATAEDVVNLVSYIKECVYKKFGVNLESEIKVIGE